MEDICTFGASKPNPRIKIEVVSGSCYAWSRPASAEGLFQLSGSAKVTFRGWTHAWSYVHGEEYLDLDAVPSFEREELSHGLRDLSHPMLECWEVSED